MMIKTLAHHLETWVMLAVYLLERRTLESTEISTLIFSNVVMETGKSS
jgi:hypothetical protein